MRTSFWAKSLMVMRTILFPTDFSKKANEALKQAINVAEKITSQLIIYHVYHRPVIEGASQQQLTNALANLEGKIDLKFKELLNKYTRLKKIDYEFRKELGISVKGIIKMVQKEKIDLIVMATRGVTEIYGELWGTKTSNVVKHVDVPILIFPDDTSLKEAGRIGLVCDYSKQTDYHTLDFLVYLAEKLKLDVDVIALNRNEKTMSSEEKAYRHLVRAQLENIHSTFNFSFNNNIEQGIVDYSKTNDIGLIAILPKSHGFIERLFHDSLTEKMTLHSHIPMLVLK